MKSHLIWSLSTEEDFLLVSLGNALNPFFMSSVFTVKLSHLHASVARREQLEQECSKFGTVSFVQLDPGNKKSATIYFDSYESAKSARDALNNKQFLGSKVQAVMKDKVDPENFIVVEPLINQAYAEIDSKFKKTYRNDSQRLLGVYTSKTQLNVLNSQVLITC